MDSITNIDPALLAPPPGVRPTHPLKNWRQTQRLVDHATKQPREWTVADAARSFSAFIGQEVPYHTWMAWEKYEDESGARRPNSFYMQRLFLFTKGGIRPDNFYPIGEWRRLLAGEAAARAATVAGDRAPQLQVAGGA